MGVHPLADARARRDSPPTAIDTTIAFITLPTGERVPALGQGTWTMAEQPDRRKDEMAALQLGVDLGMTVIDTAEAYADGEAEALVGEALGGRRDEIFIVSKVLPSNAGRAEAVAACERSLRRLATDHIDLYLLHWRTDGAPMAEETFEAFEALVGAGKIRQWGVSNFAVPDLEELEALGWGSQVGTNQILYNLRRRASEFDVIPWCRSRAIPIMAYSPIEGGRMLADPDLAHVAERLSAMPAQVALAWLLTKPDVLAIPKAGTANHVLDNYAAASLSIGADEMAVLDAVFPPPRGPMPFEMG